MATCYYVKNLVEIALLRIVMPAVLPVWVQKFVLKRAALRFRRRAPVGHCPAKIRRPPSVMYLCTHPYPKDPGPCFES